MSSRFAYKNFTSREKMVTNAADQIARAVNSAVTVKGHASLMLSGGSSPKPVYLALTQMDLPWNKVTIGLVDDRWIERGKPGSNETFLDESLFKGKAKAATFIGLKTGAAKPAEGVSEAEEKLASIAKPFDVCVMGMGLDGHTASWFPNSKGLEEALDIQNPNTVIAIDAAGCPVAGDHPERITLTLSAVMASKQIILMIPGAEKSNVFKDSAHKSVYEAPVKALRAAGERLTVMTDES
ncbi:6-phosphogluconolactonase [Hellea balneolensis]|uniref:6-phosphogluconolactonase n=1 Tax=Hellea balneolensis TaxID=287478 RepID=UPI000418C858|nr:6-phosphogluconolactonase [Hellea balneolensis]